MCIKCDFNSLWLCVKWVSFSYSHKISAKVTNKTYASPKMYIPAREKRKKPHPASLSWCAVLAGLRWSHSLAKLQLILAVGKLVPLTSFNATKRPASTPFWPSVKGIFLTWFMFCFLHLTFKSVSNSWWANITNNHKWETCCTGKCTSFCQC